MPQTQPQLLTITLLSLTLLAGMTARQIQLRAVNSFRESQNCLEQLLNTLLVWSNLVPLMCYSSECLEVCQFKTSEDYPSSLTHCRNLFLTCMVACILPVAVAIQLSRWLNSLNNNNNHLMAVCPFAEAA